MKCICGYESFRGDSSIYNFGHTDQFLEIFIKTESFEGAKSETNFHIYACPKCGTLKIEVGK